MRKANLALILGSAALCTLLFQNCGDVAFSERPDALIAKSDTPAGPGKEQQPPLPDEEVVQPVPVAFPSPSPSPTPAVEQPVPAEEGSRNFVCVLAGPGKSVKLSLDSERLFGKNGTPKNVCMSERACLEIVSQRFEVKGPEKRGFCPDKNPHVVDISEADLQTLVDAMPEPQD